MGAGKTAVGTALSAAWGIPYLDNDALLEAENGMGLLDLAAQGQAILHEAESRHLRSLADVPGPWVAGAAASLGDRPDDCSFVRAHFLGIYLHGDPETLAARLRQDPERPWLGDDPDSVIHAMYDRRDAAFRSAAAIVVDGTRQVPDVVADIVALMADTLRSEGP